MLLVLWLENYHPHSIRAVNCRHYLDCIFNEYMYCSDGSSPLTCQPLFTSKFRFLCLWILEGGRALCLSLDSSTCKNFISKQYVIRVLKHSCVTISKQTCDPAIDLLVFYIDPSFSCSHVIMVFNSISLAISAFLVRYHARGAGQLEFQVEETATFELYWHFYADLSALIQVSFTLMDTDRVWSAQRTLLWCVLAYMFA